MKLKSVAVVAATLAAMIASPAYAQLLGGGGLGSRLERMRNKMTDKNPSIQYDASCCRSAIRVSEVIAAFGEPNATQGEGTSREDVYAFIPTGRNCVDPEISAHHRRRGVYRGHVASRATGEDHDPGAAHHAVYVHYDSNDNIQSVRVVPRNRRTPAPHRHHRNRSGEVIGTTG